MPNRPKQPTTLAEVEHPRNTQPVGMGGAPTANLPVVPQAYIPAWARQSLLASQTPAWGYGGLPQKETVGFGDLRAVERAQIPGYSQPGMGGAPTANLPLFYQAPYGSPANPYVPPPRRPVGMGDLRRAEFEQAAAERSRQPQYGMGDLRRMEYLIGQYLAGSQPQASRPASGAGAGSGTTAPRRASGGGGRGGGSAPTFGPQYSRDFTQPVPRWVQAMTVWRI